jgi:hypothetical protein
MNLITDTFKNEPISYRDIQLKIPDIQLDLYKTARARGMLSNTLNLQQYLVAGFANLMQQLPTLDPTLSNGTIFPISGNKPCFNYMSQWLRLPMLKCLACCLPEEVRDEFNVPGLHKMDNPSLLPIYKKIFGYLALLKARAVILWFFFQVPNYCDYDITGYRAVYTEMCKYITEHWPKVLCFKSQDKSSFEQETLGTTWYYNLVYHGQSNKDILTFFSAVLVKVYPELSGTGHATHIKPNTSDQPTIKFKLKSDKGNALKNCITMFKAGEFVKSSPTTHNNTDKATQNPSYRQIKIAFISNKLAAYTSVFRDRIGIIKNLNKQVFDTWIVLFGDERVLKAQIMTSKVIYYYLEPFIKANHILYLSKTDVVGNQRVIATHQFDIIFYPDIGMLQAQTLLAHARLAPLQITTWGHSDTSGNPEIDYYITSKWFEQTDDLSIPKSNYSEKPVLLSSMGTYYYSPRQILTDLLSNGSVNFLNAEEFGFESIGGHAPIIIGCLQSFYKFNDAFEAVLESILKLTDPMHKGGYPVYLALSNSISFNKKHLARLNTRLEPYTARIKWFQNKTPTEWLNLVSVCHVMLDPFPFGGCNTSLEAFDYGIPVVCMPSRTMINGRFTLGFYKKMDIHHCIADSPTQYIQQALRLIQDPTYYKFVSEKILKAKAYLFEEASSIDEYQRVFVSLLEQRV